MTARVLLQSPGGQVRFEDTVDHFENGVLRLLGLDRRSFEYWLTTAEEEPGDSMLERLGIAFRRLSPMGRSQTLVTGVAEEGPGGVAGSLWHTSIADDRGVGVARTCDGNLGWLVEPHREIWRRVLSQCEPEERAQAEKTVSQHPGDAWTADWRTEKARRQVRDLAALVAVPRPRVLELGQVTGHFQAAWQEAGGWHEGIRRDASETIEVDLNDYRPVFDAITLWDFLARVPDPKSLLGAAIGCLRPGGVIAIKTPNIRCPEARLFGPHYHSLKREHLLYFSVPSLLSLAEEVGLERIRLTTISHLLAGFLGQDVVDQLSAGSQGSDIVAFFRRP